jgi:hypothetical protein
MSADHLWNAILCAEPGCYTNPGGKFFSSEDELKRHLRLDHVGQSSKVQAPEPVGSKCSHNSASQSTSYLTSAIENLTTEKNPELLGGDYGCTKRPQQQLPEPGPAAGKTRRRAIGNWLFSSFMVYHRKLKLANIS